MFISHRIYVETTAHYFFFQMIEAIIAELLEWLTIPDGKTKAGL